MGIEFTTIGDAEFNGAISALELVLRKPQKKTRGLSYKIFCNNFMGIDFNIIGDVEFNGDEKNEGRTQRTQNEMERSRLSIIHFFW